MYFYTVFDYFINKLSFLPLPIIWKFMCLDLFHNAFPVGLLWLIIQFVQLNSYQYKLWFNSVYIAINVKFR